MSKSYSENSPENSSVSEKNSKEPTPAGSLVMLSSYFIASMTILSYLGYHLDTSMGNSGYYFTLLGAMLGFFWSMYETVKTVRRLEKKSTDSGDNHDK